MFNLSTILDTHHYAGRHVRYANSPNPNSQSEREFMAERADTTTSKVYILVAQRLAGSAVT